MPFYNLKKKKKQFTKVISRLMGLVFNDNVMMREINVLQPLDEENLVSPIFWTESA